MKYLRVTVRYYTLPNAMVGIKIQWHKSMHQVHFFLYEKWKKYQLDGKINCTCIKHVLWNAFKPSSEEF